MPFVFLFLKRKCVMTGKYSTSCRQFAAAHCGETNDALGAQPAVVRFERKVSCGPPQAGGCGPRSPDGLAFHSALGEQPPPPDIIPAKKQQAAAKTAACRITIQIRYSVFSQSSSDACQASR